MMLLFNEWEGYQIRSRELARLVESAQVLLGDDYDLLKQNYKQLSELINKILKLSKKENEWRLYFDAMYYMLFLQKNNHNNMEVIKYAEIYYKECDLHMDAELPQYRDTDMDVTNVHIYNIIFKAYSEYAQIGDAKMAVFMERYKENVTKYGCSSVFYQDEMHLDILYRDADMAREAAKNFLKHEKEQTSCYVCKHKMYLYQLLLTGQDRKAEELMLKLINRNIPKEDLWCYEYCKNAEPEVMYRNVLEECVWDGKTETFWYFYEKYWKKLPHENQWKKWPSAAVSLFCALDGDFGKLSGDIEEIEKDIEDDKESTTLGIMTDALRWWCYFILLDRSGVHEAAIHLPGLEAGETGLVPTLAVSSYMEKKADEYGGLFARARAKFDYKFTKEAYRECMLSYKNR